MIEFATASFEFYKEFYKKQNKQIKQLFCKQTKLSFFSLLI